MALARAWNPEAERILEELGLSRYCEEKITVQEARSIRKTDEKAVTDLPWRILQGILFGNYEARDIFLESFSSSNGDNDSEDLEKEGMHQWYADDEGDDNGSNSFSTLDVLSLIFSCCDPFLKQIFAKKLFLCKLAMPLLNYSLENGKPILSVWALRTIDLNGESAVEKPMPMVSFLRVGNLTEGFSKSKIVNDVLNPNNQQTFVNYDCPNGYVRRVLTDGIVECSWWFYSDPNENDSYKECAMVLNLKGDATKHQGQYNFLCDISSIVVVVITSKEMQDTQGEKIKDIIKKGVQLVLILLISGDVNGKAKVQKEVQSCLSAIRLENITNFQLLVNRDKMGNLKSANKFVNEIKSGLIKLIPKTIKKSLAEALKDSSFQTDERNEQCEQARMNAVEITNKLTKVAAENQKSTLLPMQENQWKEYCTLDKKLHREYRTEGQTIEQYKEDIKRQMKNCRKLTLPSPECVGKLFCQGLIADDHNKLHFFLKWVSLALDKESRKTLPKLREEYGKKWCDLQNSKEDTNERKQLSKEVNNLEEKMVNSALGLEHFFREIGQMFELSHGNHPNDADDFRAVPSILAKLSFNGYPCEIIDGDASGIPLILLEEVFQELTKLITEKKVLVVSVLGIQSSGKSTLLNAMFGTEFAVSAGRCTRGAFMQLVPVDKTTDVPFDYIVLIDTEGLRALELKNLKHDHDNELATFAVGIADITVINIKGENSTEIKDVLEIVVHALLRMKAAEKIHFNRTCLFLHQNVPSADADQMMMHSRHRLLESLDEVTKQAAVSENVPDIQGFRDVINCDIEEHIWYLPDLWNGHPPLAPVSPRYSDQVQKIKECILKIAKENKMFLKLPDMFLRIKDLWKGILSENFVFSFRNSLEKQLYIELNSFFQGLLWELYKEESSFKERNATKSIKACATVSEVNECEYRLMNEIRAKLYSKHTILKAQLDEYFQSHAYQEIIIQWKTAKEHALQNEIDNLLENMRQSLHNIGEHHKSCLKHKTDSKNNLASLMELATAVAIQLRNQGKSTEKEIEQNFEKFWTENYYTDSQEETVNIEAEMQNGLLDAYKDKHYVLLKQFQKIRLSEHPFGSLKEVLSDGYVFKASSRWQGLKNFFMSRDVTVYVQDRVLEISDHLEGSLADQCKNTFEPFQIGTIRKFVCELHAELGKFGKETHQNHIKLPEDFIVTLAVQASLNAVKKYEEAQDEYIKKHSLQAYFQSFKQDTWHVFRNTVKQSTNEFIAAEMFCDKVGSFIEEEVFRKISEHMMQSAMNDLSHNKFHLLKRILKNLAEKGKFKQYVYYINDAYSFALCWLQEFCNEKLFTIEDGISSYSRLASENKNLVIQEVLKALSTASAEAPESNDLEAWISLFCKNVDLPISAGDLELVGQRQTEVSYSNLMKIIKKVLEDKKIVDNDKNHIKQIKWPGEDPFKTMMGRIWGCKEVCPFCKEPCSNTNVKHYETDKMCHTCIKHKPRGVRGTYWYDTEKIVADTCGFAIHANHRFGCIGVNFKCRTAINCPTEGADWVWHNHRDYKGIFPEWDILPDPSHSAVKYWQWFMKTYAKELADYYKREEPDIPDSWKDITKEQAIESLNEYY